MTLEHLMLQSEAIVFASDKPITPQEICNILVEQFPDNDIDINKIEQSLSAIKEKYDTPFHSFGITEIGGGFQFLTKKEYHDTIGKINGDKFLKRLSTAAMETLAIIAYKQPITKPDIEHIRGVNCDYSVQKLLEKELIIITGRNEDAVGKPLLYATSKSFIDYLGLNSMDALPKITELFPTVVEPTAGTEALPNENVQLVVTENGNLEAVSLNAENKEAEEKNLPDNAENSTEENKEQE